MPVLDDEMAWVAHEQVRGPRGHFHQAVHRASDGDEPVTVVSSWAHTRGLGRGEEAGQDVWRELGAPGWAGSHLCGQSRA